MTGNIVFLAAQTARSQAYGQAMLANKLIPDHIILLAASNTRKGKAASVPDKAPIGDCYVPDLSVPLEKTLAEMKKPVIKLETSELDTDQLGEIFKELEPSVVIYSGYGGQIVPPALCKEWDLLHIHSGWLPEYRGSTTIYYSWLEKGWCGASAILLHAQIDQGPILFRERYEPPGKGVDPDYLYDTTIRADLLIKALEYYKKNNSWPEKVDQNEQDGSMYFKIHPVLKNILYRN